MGEGKGFPLSFFVRVSAAHRTQPGLSDGMPILWSDGRISLLRWIPMHKPEDIQYNKLAAAEHESWRLGVSKLPILCPSAYLSHMNRAGCERDPLNTMNQMQPQV